MTENVENIRRPRLFLLNMVKDLDLIQLNHIPDRFHNNIIWNMGHLIWAQQDCYVKSRLTPSLDKKYLELYKTGTFPKKTLSENEISEVKRLLIEPLDIMADDLYNCSATVKKSIQGLPLHDWLHVGYILAMKRLV